ncbi:20S-pre-rRNA D-site endonuclease nob1 [Saitoella coloradoensis]
MSETTASQTHVASTSLAFGEPNGPTIDSLVLDSGPIISASMNTLRAKAAHFYTIPRVIQEIKDPASRAKLALWEPFLTVRAPQEASLKHVASFARKTGDYEVMSGTDMQVIALTYELECELNGGDWRLRNVPGQKGPNGVDPKKLAAEKPQEEDEEAKVEGDVEQVAEQIVVPAAPLEAAPDAHETVVSSVQVTEEPEAETQEIAEEVELAEEEEEESDGEGWITPSNIAAHKAKDASTQDVTSSKPQYMKAACSTGDFAMQNVMLQMGLNLINYESGARIKTVKTWVMRCHACFKITRKMNEKFCPGCGGATLMRTSCATDSNGNFRVFLKKNMQWHTKGNVYSLPKPTAGRANQKGVFNPILRADQKEYERAQKRHSKKKEVDLLDPDWMPGLLSGQRGGPGQQGIKIGLGRNINERQKRTGRKKS